MTGNSMDAIDLVLTEFKDDNIKDICYFSKSYSKNMQHRIKILRELVYQKSKAEIEKIEQFQEAHYIYIKEIAEAVDEMCRLYNIKKNSIDAIGFHGKTLDHFPPSVAQIQNQTPYTLQMGSGQMLADLTSIPTVYDFRSDFVMKGFEGAPLVAPHNVRISRIEGDGLYFNGGNTSNFAIIQDGNILISTDAGPFNEYTDAYLRERFDLPFDKDGQIGSKGKIDPVLLQNLFDFGRTFYETALPKSGDPAYYFKNQIFEYISKQQFSDFDVVRTFEYFAAYIAVFTLSLIPDNIKLSNRIILFGGGWKNPLVFNDFQILLRAEGMILKEHEELFLKLKQRLPQEISVIKSAFGNFMEARLMADLAYHKLLNLPWDLPEVAQKNEHIVCGQIALPSLVRNIYNDKLNRAAKGWDK